MTAIHTIHTTPLNRPGCWIRATDGTRTIDVESVDHESELGAHLQAARRLIGSDSRRLSSQELHNGSWFHDYTTTTP
jgi:hypothetical protein